MWLVNFNYNFEYDWLIELSNNKLSNSKVSDNNLTIEIVGNRSFLNQSQWRKLQFLWLTWKKLLDSDWLREVQFKCNTPVQKV